MMAPAEGSNPAYVRAIADGKVVYVRKTDTTHKPTLQYRNVRTDNGCVVIRHDTEIGEGDNAKLTYYSVYLHLQTAQPTLSVGGRFTARTSLARRARFTGNTHKSISRSSATRRT